MKKQEVPLTFVETKPYHRVCFGGDNIKAEPFDWYSFLQKEEYTINELYNAKRLAGDWVTCACGNQCAIIPRSGQGVPEDDELTSLGQEFYNCIVDMYGNKLDNFEDYTLKYLQNCAIKTLEKIEARSFELICEILKENSDPQV